MSPSGFPALFLDGAWLVAGLAGALLALALLWVAARAGRPSPCDEREDAPTEL